MKLISGKKPIENFLAHLRCKISFATMNTKDTWPTRKQFHEKLLKKANGASKSNVWQEKLPKLNYIKNVKKIKDSHVAQQ